ncbi:Ribose-phosphate pyrophosphokinase [Sphingomonas paucimobilis]|nr:Ribose-phosphate pyrophosphokinase [Sphingomonas paucimobilis]
MKLMTGNSNLPLAKAISSYLEVPLTEALVRRFADEEIFVEIQENVRGEDVFVIQSTGYPVNDNLMELLIMIDALKRASARRITAVIPYFGYARQDRKPGPRTPISAKLVANLITVAGADRVLSVDLHAGQIQGFFDIPTDNLYAAPVMSADILARFKNDNLMVVSPDVGGVVRARQLAKRLNNAPLAIVDKRRERAGESEVMNIIGDVEGRFCILIDDIVDSAGTLCNAAAALRQAGGRGRRRLCHPRRAVGRRGGASRGLGAARTGHHRLDRQSRVDRRDHQDPPPAHRPAAGRGDQAHRGRDERFQPVRLILGRGPSAIVIARAPVTDLAARDSRGLRLRSG